MALSLSSVSFVVSSSSSCSRRSISRSPTCLSSNKGTVVYNPISPFPSSSRLRSRNSRVRSTVMQENEEKMVVEDSFQSKSFLDNKEEGSGGEPPESTSSSVLERWTIKIEQSLNIVLTDSVIKILDVFYRDRDYARFFVLETIARVPYFAFISVLHLYESFGWWRQADYLKVHFAESWNEMHHLLIMEELGGNGMWFDRFLSQHIAVFYYFMIVFMYMISPRMAYHFSECVEIHAFETYDKFIKRKGDELKTLPAPAVAVKYYTEGDLYMFDEFQTDRLPNTRRPVIDNLYDVFMNIRDDEAEHCKTMKACQIHGSLRSPHSYPPEASINDDAPHSYPPEASIKDDSDATRLKQVL